MENDDKKPDGTAVCDETEEAQSEPHIPQAAN